MTVFALTFTLFSFKSVNTGEEKLVSLKNYKINKENLKKYYAEYNSDVVANSRVGCRYYCYVKALAEVVALVTEFAGYSTVTGQDVTLEEGKVIELEKMKILEKI